MTTLLIVESPAKCKKIEEYLGPGYKCIATFGHFRDLPDLKHVDIANNFKPRFSLMGTKSSQIKKLKDAIAASSDVLLATDDDREGEGIAWHVCDYFGLSFQHTKRIVFREITKSAVLHAVANPKRLDMLMVDAQQARQILDLVVGFKLSPVLWQNISQRTKTGLSAGRCQTPALRLVYDNQKEIDSAPGDKKYDTTGYFGDKNIPFVLNRNFESEDEAEKFLCDSVPYSHVLSKAPIAKSSKPPPKPFTTSSVQQAANNELRISPKDTMKSLQSLYEAGYITYMRTDSAKYSLEFISEAKSFVNKKWGEKFIMPDIESNLSSSTSKDTGKKGKGDPKTQDAHEAIRPTKVALQELKGGDLTPRDIRVYGLVWRNTVESCMANAEFNILKCELSAPQDCSYKYASEQLIFPGWKAVKGGDDGDRLFGYLSLLKEGTICKYNKITSKLALKNLKQHFSEARLVQMLEKKGIGRPSTFSSLVDKIQSRGYVTKQNVPGKTMKCIDYELVGNELEEIETERTFGNEKGKLVIQPLGILVLEFLLKHFSQTFDYQYTRIMEDRLDEVAKGTCVWHNICRECLEDIESSSELLTSSDKVSIKIDKNHTYIVGKNGPVIKCTEGSKTTFKSVRDDIDIAVLEKGGYKLNEIVTHERPSGTYLGNIDGEPASLRTGKFGPYIQWKGGTKSLSSLGLSMEEITIEQVTQALKGNLSSSSGSGVLRSYTDSLSLRSGKYGPYVFFRTKGMSKPRFINLKGFKANPETCDEQVMIQWLKDEHKLTSI